MSVAAVESSFQGMPVGVTLGGDAQRETLDLLMQTQHDAYTAGYADAISVTSQRVRHAQAQRAALAAQENRGFFSRLFGSSST